MSVYRFLNTGITECMSVFQDKKDLNMFYERLKRETFLPKRNDTYLQVAHHRFKGISQESITPRTP